MTPARRARRRRDLIRASGSARSRVAGFVGTGKRPVAAAAAKVVRIDTMGDRGESAPRITSKLDVANNLSWSHEVEYALRYRALWCPRTLRRQR